MKKEQIAVGCSTGQPAVQGWRLIGQHLYAWLKVMAVGALVLTFTACVSFGTTTFRGGLGLQNQQGPTGTLEFESTVNWEPDSFTQARQQEKSGYQRLKESLFGTSPSAGTYAPRNQRQLYSR